MELKVSGYLIFLIIMFAVKDLEGSLTVGGGQFDNALTVGESAYAYIHEGAVPVWMKVDFEQPSLVTLIRFNVEVINDVAIDSLKGFVHVLLLEDRDDIPDPTKHHSCHEMEVLYPGREFIHDVQCPRSPSSQAVALWATRRLDLKVFQVIVESTEGQMISLRKPVTAGGGECHKVLDGRYQTYYVVPKGDSPVWMKLEFRNPSRMTKIRMEAEVFRLDSLIDTAHVLMLGGKGDSPDPTKHQSCYEMPIKISITEYPQAIGCPGSNYEAVAMWAGAHRSIKATSFRVEVLYNVAYKRPVTAGGGFINNVIAGSQRDILPDDRRPELLEDDTMDDRAEDVIMLNGPGWLKIVLQKPSFIHEINFNLSITYTGVGDIHAPFLPHKDDHPDPVNQYSCFQHNGSRGVNKSNIGLQHCAYSLPTFAVVILLRGFITATIHEIVIFSCSCFYVDGLTRDKGYLSVTTPVMVGGSRWKNVADGDDYSRVRIFLGSSPSWVRIELFEKYRISVVSVKAKLARFNLEYSPARLYTHILLFSNKYHIPDPTNHFSCYHFLVPVHEITLHPRTVDCSSTDLHQAVALWADAGIVSKIYEIKVEEYSTIPRPQIETTAPQDEIIPVKGYAYILTVSTTVLLGGQFLVLLIQRLSDH